MKEKELPKLKIKRIVQNIIDFDDWTEFIEKVYNKPYDFTTQNDVRENETEWYFEVPDDNSSDEKEHDNSGDFVHQLSLALIA